MLAQFVRLSVAFLLLAAPMQRPQTERIIAIGDVHGELDEFVTILKATGLIDNARQWTGGRATLVQTGDLIDRGPKSRAVLDFLMNLQREAPRRGGSVMVSLGNHEVMNMMGDMRYVVAEDFAAFADSRSEERRKTAYREYARIQTKAGRPTDEAVWMQTHPAGFVEHREAFGPQGKYGKWLRSLPAINKVGDSIFLHGGINPALGVKSINQLNTAIQSEMEAYDRITKFLIDKDLARPFFSAEEFLIAAEGEAAKLKSKNALDLTDADRAQIQALEGLLGLSSWASVHDDGPLWFRGYDRWSDAEGEALITKLIQTLGVKRIVVGHTPQLSGEVRSRFGGKVFLIDTALLRGRPSALEISNGKVRAIYPNRQTDLD